MRAVGMVAPPDDLHESHTTQSWRDEVRETLLGVIEPDCDQLRVTPDRLLHVIRLLTFSASHAEIADNELLTPEEIVDAVLHGMLANPGRRSRTQGEGEPTC
jgi:hypothetical protein